MNAKTAKRQLEKSVESYLGLFERHQKSNEAFLILTGDISYNAGSKSLALALYIIQLGARRGEIRRRRIKTSKGSHPVSCAFRPEIWASTNYTSRNSLYWGRCSDGCSAHFVAPRTWVLDGGPHRNLVQPALVFWLKNRLPKYQSRPHCDQNKSIKHGVALHNHGYRGAQQGSAKYP
jgi:hypothetical protein